MILRFELADPRALLILFSVLLATLEYFSGIIFLTTNLSEGIDDAVLSRIDIHIPYPHLTYDTRRALWEDFINLPMGEAFMSHQSNALVSSDDLDNLATWEVNGRHIKHAVKNARKWCYAKGIALTCKALETGLMMTAPNCARAAEGGVTGANPRKRRREVTDTDQT